MKIRAATIAFLLAESAVSAFTVTQRAVHRRGSKPLFETATATTTTTTDLEKAMPDGASVMDALGIKDGNLALGVNPEEVLKYIGT